MMVHMRCWFGSLISASLIIILPAGWEFNVPICCWTGIRRLASWTLDSDVLLEVHDFVSCVPLILFNNCWFSCSVVPTTPLHDWVWCCWSIWDDLNTQRHLPHRKFLPSADSLLGTGGTGFQPLAFFPNLYTIRFWGTISKIPTL